VGDYFPEQMNCQVRVFSIISGGFAMKSVRCFLILVVLLLVPSCNQTVTKQPVVETVVVVAIEEVVSTPEDSQPMRLFVEEGERFPLFSTDDGVVFLQSKINGLLPNFWGNLATQDGYQIQNVSYEIVSSTVDHDYMMVEINLDIMAKQAEQDIQFAGTGVFVWYQTESYAWQIQAEFSLFSEDEINIIIWQDQITVEYVDDISFTVYEEYEGQYSIGGVEFGFSSDAGTLVTQEYPGRIGAKTDQYFELLNHGKIIYKENSTLLMDKIIYSDEDVEYDWSLYAYREYPNEEFNHERTGHVHQRYYDHGDSIEVVIEELSIKVDEQEIFQPDPTTVRLTEVAEDEFVIDWQPYLVVNDQPLPTIEFESRFNITSIDDKTDIREELTISVPELEEEQVFLFHLDPSSFRDFLVYKAIATGAGAIGGAAKAGLTTWWLGPGVTVSVPAGAIFGGFVGDIGYTFGTSSVRLAWRLGLLTDTTPPTIGFGLRRSPQFYQMEDDERIDYASLELDLFILFVDEESGIKTAEATIANIPKKMTYTVPTNKSMIVVKFEPTLKDSKGTGKISSGQIEATATNGQGLSLSAWHTSYSYDATSEDATPPSIEHHSYPVAWDDAQDCQKHVEMITVGDPESGIKHLGYRLDDGGEIPVVVKPIGRLSYTMWGLYDRCETDPQTLTVSATNIVGKNTTQSWVLKR
jgi:hypothetical protein